MTENGGLLCLRHTLITSNDLELLAEDLSSCHSDCVELDLEHCNLGMFDVPDCQSLVSLLMVVKPSLRVLRLGYNHLTNLGSKHIARALCVFPALEHVDLTCNTIDLKGALVMVQEFSQMEHSPFTLVLYNNQMNEVEARQLLAAGQKHSVDIKIETNRLLVAAERGHLKLLKLMLESDMSPESTRRFFARTSAVHTALDVCVANGHIDCVQYLLSLGSYMGSLGTSVQFDVKGALLVGVAMNNETMVRYLFGCIGPNADCLALAAKNNCAQLVTLCLEAQVDVNSDRSADGMTPLHLAVQAGRLRMVRRLIAARASLHSAMHGGSTPLHLTARSGQHLMCQELLNKGASPSDVDDRGWTPLHEAANNARWEICDLLLENKASLAVRDKISYTPYRVARTDIPMRLRLRMCLEEETLSLRGLNLNEVPKALQRARRLTSLDLRDNPIEGLPVWLCQLPLKRLFLKGCPLKTIPQSVLSSTPDAILSFLHDIGNPEKTMTWRTAKMMVLGREAAGKTTLMHKIRDEKYETNLSTDGIDVVQFKIGELKLQWFDFGGQEVFYPTHQFFLTPQCVYLVVFSLEDSQFLRRVQYWLAVISTYTTGKGRPPRVAVVGTFLDKVTDERLAEVREELEPLMLKHRFVKGYLTVSCRTGENIDATRSAIVKMFVDSNLDEQQVPCSYERVYNMLCDKRAEGVKRLSFSESGVSWMTPQQLTTCLTFLHYMGLIFYSADVGIILDVKWLAETFATLISFKSNWATQGQVSPDDLSLVWKDWPDHSGLISLFLQFGIAFQLRSGHLVIPCLFRQERTSVGVLQIPRTTRKFQRRLALPVVPLGLLGRVVVRMKTHPGRLMKEIWRTGCQLTNAQENEWADVCVRGSEIVISVVCTDDAKSDALLVWIMQQVTDIVFQVFLMDEENVSVTVACSHCLMEGVRFPQQLPLKELRESVLKWDSKYMCGGETLDVALLGRDISLGICTIYDGSQLEMGELIGAGAFGDVYKATLVSTGELVAVKEIQLSDTEGEESARELREFFGECALMAELEHPLIVNLFGIMIKPNLGMVLELVPGGDLHSMLVAGQVATDDIKLRIAADIAIGMAFLHGQLVPIAHRDLRSPNVLVVSLDPSAEVCVKVADFGLSVSVTSVRTDSLGTWQWLPPEVLLGRAYSESCDLYSYGMVLYEIFSDGRPPFDEYQQFITRHENAIEFYCPICAKKWFDTHVEVAGAESMARMKGGTPASPVCVCRGASKLQSVVVAWKETLDKQSAIREISEQGLRPTVPPNTPVVVSTMMEQLWMEPDERPSFRECVARLRDVTSVPETLIQSIVQVNSSNESSSTPTVNLLRQLKKTVCRLDDEILCMEKIGQWVYLGGRSGTIHQMDSLTPDTQFKLSSLHAVNKRVVAMCGVGNYLWTASEDMIVNGIPLDLIESLRDKPTKSRSSSISGSRDSNKTSPRRSRDSNRTSPRRNSSSSAPKGSGKKFPSFKKMIRSVSGSTSKAAPAVIAVKEHAAEITSMIAVTHGQAHWIITGDAAGQLSIVKDGKFLLSLMLRESKPVVALQRTDDPSVILAVVASDLYSLSLDTLRVKSSIFSRIISGGFVRDTVLFGDTLLVANGPSGEMSVFDMSVARRPVLVETVRAVDGRMYAFQRIMITGKDYLFVGGEKTVAVWNLLPELELVGTLSVQGRVKVILDLGHNIVWIAQIVNNVTEITHLDFHSGFSLGESRTAHQRVSSLSY